jgi:hypothetical protein
MCPTEQGRYPWFGVPPARQPRPAVDEPTLVGKRVVLSTPSGFVYDARAVSELRTDGEGNLFIDVLTEPEYFHQDDPERRRSPSTWPAHLVWVE